MFPITKYWAKLVMQTLNIGNCFQPVTSSSPTFKFNRIQHHHCVPTLDVYMFVVLCTYRSHKRDALLSFTGPILSWLLGRPTNVCQIFVAWHRNHSSLSSASTKQQFSMVQMTHLHHDRNKNNVFCSPIPPYAIYSCESF